MRKRILALATCLMMGLTNTTAFAYTAEVCQGNTPDVQDVLVFQNKLGAKYGSGNVSLKGYSNGKITIADSTDFANAKNYDVLYWSSHGGHWDDEAVLNITENDSKAFNTFPMAENWKNTSKLKVAILGSCCQFDGNVLRGKWADIMKNSGLKVLAGYHDKSPTTGVDTNIANEFFRLANETTSSSQGNSVRYAWQQANIANGASAKWIVLGYKTNRLEYYRLPGFPGSFDATPSSKTVYRYTSKNIDGTDATAPASFIDGDMPYKIEVSRDKLAINPEVLNSQYETMPLSDDPSAKMIYIRENTVDPIDAESVKQNNASAIVDLGLESSLMDAAVSNYALLETEILDDGMDGSENTIGMVTTYQQNFRGIPLENNFFTVCSDKEGVFSVINRWSDIGESETTDSIMYGISDAKAKLPQTLGGDSSAIDNAQYIYKKAEDGTYRLSVKMITENNQQYYMDTATGEISEN